MLKRNSGVKESPQRWQDNAADGAFDVVFTFEERVFDMVIDGTLIVLFVLPINELLKSNFSFCWLLELLRVAWFLGLTQIIIVPYCCSSYIDCHFSVLIADLENRETKLLKLALVINLDVKDNHEEAAIGGKLALDLCQRVRVIFC